MKQWVLIFSFLCILVMPFSMYADEDGIIGTNPGLDFYSRIDDASDSLAQTIVNRRLNEKWNYSSLGCNIPWLNGQRIDQRLLDELLVGNYSSLNKILSIKKISIDSPTQSKVVQCLVEKYNDLQRSAHLDQNTLETVGNIWLYMDGDMTNSDYDIVSDITKINAIIFKEKYDYKGTKNASARAISNMLAGWSVAPLFPTSPSVGGGTPTSPGTTWWTPGWSTWWPSSPSPTPSTPPPWAWVCSAVNSGLPTSVGSGLFGDGFFDDLDATLAGGWVGDGMIPISGSMGWATPSPAFDHSNFGSSEGSDFFHKSSCDGDSIFCITIDMKASNMNMLGWFSNTSIESLLEQHSKMMEPISRGDLSGQKMTNNLFQLPFLNVKIANKIAGGRISLDDSPQLSKRLKGEETKETKDAVFDAAFRCAMNEAGLSGDSLLSNGFIGAGYVLRRGQTTKDVQSSILPVWPQEMDNLAGCYNIRIRQWQKIANDNFATDLNEIQGFTQAMTKVIRSILDADMKLDWLPTK